MQPVVEKYNASDDFEASRLMSIPYEFMGQQPGL
jgi:hypothetical protein